MKTKNHDTLSELRDFVAHQAVEDAALSASERPYQKGLVRDVLAQEQLKPGVFKELVDDYSGRVARHIAA